MELDAALRKGFRLGDWEIRPIEGLVSGPQGTRHLQPKTMDVLVCLAALSGQVVTRDELIDRVWGGAAVSDEPLTRCIHEIRRSLGDHRDEPAYIKTIPKRGYQLLAEVGDPEPDINTVAVPDSAAENLFWQVTRQRVLRVGVIYALLAWLFVELARFAERRASAELLPPDWLMPALVLTALLGFPIAIFYAWVRQIKFDDTGRAVAPGSMFPGMAGLLWSRRGIDIVLVTLVISALAGFALDVVPSLTAASPGQEKLRIAVMPFEAGFDSGTENWLGKGIAEDLRNRLMAYDALAVSSRALSFRNTLQGVKAQQLGQELKVQYLLQGLVVRGADNSNMRIKARLTDAITGFELWSGAFNQPATALFDVQQEIVTAVATFLDLDPVQQSAIATEWPTVLNIAAYDSYLRGRNQLRNADDAEMAGLAAAWFQQALAVDPQLPMARNGLCQAYVREAALSMSDRAYNKANQACAEAILQSPDSVAAHLALADFYRVTGHAENAIQEYAWVSEKQPNNFDAWLGLARAHWLISAGDAAEQAFHRAMELKADDAECYTEFARFLIAAGRYTEAVEVARYLVQLDRDQVNTYEYLAEASFMTGEFEAAIQASRQVLSRDNTHRAAIMMIAHSYYYLGSYKRAGNIYRQAVKLLPGDHFAVGGLANTYAQLNEAGARAIAQQTFLQARELAEAALLSAGTDALTTISLAYYCAALGDRPCAERYRVRALELAPSNVEVLYRSALVYAQNGDMQAASAATQRALELGYPQALIVTDPLLADVWSQRRFATAGLVSMFAPVR